MNSKFILTRVAIAAVLSTVIEAIVYYFTANGFLCIGLSLFLLGFFIFMLLTKNIVNFFYKVLFALIAIAVVAACLMFGNVKNKNLEKDVDNNTSVSQQDNKEEKNDEKQDDEANKEDEHKDENEGCNCGCEYCCGRKIRPK